MLDCLCVIKNKKRKCFKSIHERYGRTQRTALHWAARYDNHECFAALINAGANIEEKDIDNATSLTLAAWKGHCQSIRTLLARGASKYHIKNEQLKVISACLDKGARNTGLIYISIYMCY